VVFDAEHGRPGPLPLLQHDDASIAICGTKYDLWSVPLGKRLDRLTNGHVPILQAVDEAFEELNLLSCAPRRWKKRRTGGRNRLAALGKTLPWLFAPIGQS
jgi:hypothetical protein